MSYGIMRVEKRKRDAVYGLQIEANRTPADGKAGRDFTRSNIDWEKTKENLFFPSYHRNHWNQYITDRIKEREIKERKDSVVMLDTLYTASPEWFEKHTEEEKISFFRRCLSFHIREFCDGDSSLVINAVIHQDEATPHMQIASVPICRDTPGKYHLSAKKIMGNKTDYQKRQDKFYEQVSSRYGMLRGETDTGRKHHIQTQEYTIQEQKEEIARNNRKCTSLMETNAKLETKNDDLEAKRQALTARYDEVELNWIEIKETLEATNTSVSEAQAELKATQDKILSLKSEANQLSKKKLKEEQAVQQLQETKISLENSVSQLEQQETRLKSSQSALVACNGELQGKIRKAQETLQRANTSISEAQAKLKATQDRILGLESDADQLSKKKMEEKQAIQQLQETKISLENSVSQLEQQETRLKGSVDALTVRNEELRKSTHDEKQRLDRPQNERERCEEQLSHLLFIADTIADTARDNINLSVKEKRFGKPVIECESREQAEAMIEFYSNKTVVEQLQRNADIITSQNNATARDRAKLEEDKKKAEEKKKELEQREKANRDKERENYEKERNLGQLVENLANQELEKLKGELKNQEESIKRKNKLLDAREKKVGEEEKVLKYLKSQKDLAEDHDMYVNLFVETCNIPKAKDYLREHTNPSNELAQTIRRELDKKEHEQYLQRNRGYGMER